MRHKNFRKYAQVYSHIWHTYGSSWLVRLSFCLHIITRVCKLIIHPIIVSQLIASLTIRDFSRARLAVIQFVAFSLLIGVLTPLTRYVAMLGENRVYAKLTGDYFAKLMTTDLSYFNSNLAGYLTTATRQYVDSGVLFVRAWRHKYLTTLLSIIFPLGVIMYIDIWLGIVTLAISLVQIVYLMWSSHLIGPLRTQAREMYKQNSGYMADIISNILAVKAAAQDKTYINQVLQNAYQEGAIFKRRYTKQAKLITVREFISVTFFMLLLWLMVQRMSSGAINIAGVVLVTTYALTILTSIYSLSEDWDEHDDSVDKIIPAFEILNRTNTVSDPVQPIKIAQIRGDILFDNVSFSYEKKQNVVLQDFSLHIPPGQKLGIVGLSGAGKSTLTKLLLRFSDPDNGTIALDGHDIKDITQSDLRRQIAYVPQEPLLFHASIQDNVRLADPSTSVKAIEQALKKAHAWSFVSQLPEGLDSIVGERGVKLSGGQKQRIAIARAVLQQSPIMILDEATSALDSESEQIIKASFKEILKDRTAIVVAHRLSTLSDMDRIVVIDNGRIVEDGKHTTLLRKGGLYAALWQRQLHISSED